MLGVPYPVVKGSPFVVLLDVMHTGDSSLFAVSARGVAVKDYRGQKHDRGVVLVLVVGRRGKWQNEIQQSWDILRAFGLWAWVTVASVVLGGILCLLVIQRQQCARVCSWRHKILFAAPRRLVHHGD